MVKSWCGWPVPAQEQGVGLQPPCPGPAPPPPLQPELSRGTDGSRLVVAEPALPLPPVSMAPSRPGLWSCLSGPVSCEPLAGQAPG